MLATRQITSSKGHRLVPRTRSRWARAPLPQLDRSVGSLCRGCGPDAEQAFGSSWWCRAWWGAARHHRRAAPHRLARRRRSRADVQIDRSVRVLTDQAATALPRRRVRCLLCPLGTAWCESWCETAGSKGLRRPSEAREGEQGPWQTRRCHRRRRHPQRRTRRGAARRTRREPRRIVRSGHHHRVHRTVELLGWQSPIEFEHQNKIVVA